MSQAAASGWPGNDGGDDMRMDRVIGWGIAILIVIGTVFLTLQRLG
ncbi:MAG: hypothetical protein WBF51_04220 [Candidatus Dormiibacterota bacterium]